MDLTMDMDGGIFSACVGGNLPVVKNYIENHGQVNVKNCMGNTLLNLAALYDHVGIVEELLKHSNADIDAVNNCGESSLFLAAMNGNIDVVHVLSEYGADIIRPDKMGRTPMSIASLNRRDNIVELIREYLPVDVKPAKR